MKPTKAIRKVEGWYIRYNPAEEFGWEACTDDLFDFWTSLHAWTYPGLRFAIWNKNRRMRKARMLEEVTNNGAPEC